MVFSVGQEKVTSSAVFFVSRVCCYATGAARAMKFDSKSDDTTLAGFRMRFGSLLASLQHDALSYCRGDALQAQKKLEWWEDGSSFDRYDFGEAEWVIAAKNLLENLEPDKANAYEFSVLIKYARKAANARKTSFYAEHELHGDETLQDNIQQVLDELEAANTALLPHLQRRLSH